MLSRLSLKKDPLRKPTNPTEPSQWSPFNSSTPSPPPPTILPFPISGICMSGDDRRCGPSKGVLSDAISMTLQERSNCQKAKFPLGGSHNTPLTHCRDQESPRIKSILTSPPHCLHVRDLAGNIALCSRKRHFPLTVTLSASDLFLS